jgi:Pathogenicity locus
MGDRVNPSKVNRNHQSRLTDLPNIGKASAADLVLLGIDEPSQLIGRCPFALYEALCEKTGVRHDPCVMDVFMSITRFMDGEAAKPWWAFTEERKRAVLKRLSAPK